MDGDRVKVTLRLRGREMVHADMGMKVIERVVTDLAELGKMEKPPMRERNFIFVTILPDKRR